MSSASSNFYVVKKGHKTGIFKTWAECKAATEGFKGPIFKKFDSFEKANDFFRSKETGTIRPKAYTDDKPITQEQATRLASSEEMEKIKKMAENIKSSPFSDELNYNVAGWNTIENEIYLFTDGSSRKTRDMPNSGVGLYLGYQCTNINEQYDNRTNNQCELQAMDYAFKLIVRYYRELSAMGKVVKIVSDSEYSIKACSLWIANWKKNNWKTAKGEDVKNRELIESIDGSMNRIKVINSQLPDDKKIKVKLIHVNSHQAPDMTDKIKFSIWFGNYVADALAQNTI